MITDYLQLAFKIAARNYYDDKFGFTEASLVKLEVDVVRDLHRWLGADFSEDKIQYGMQPVILGIGYDLKQMRLFVTPERKEDLLCAIDSVLESGTLTPAFAAKLKGRLEHVAAHFWGRFGRTFLR